MKLFVFFIIASLFVASIYGVPNRRYRGRCRDLSDCPCGSQCVSRFSNSPCGRGGISRFCVCRRGCTVGNIFIPAGTSNPSTYCNSCSCPRNSARSKGIPACTRRAWCRLPVPRGKSIYPRNPNCL